MVEIKMADYITNMTFLPIIQHENLIKDYNEIKNNNKKYNEIMGKVLKNEHGGYLKELVIF